MTKGLEALFYLEQKVETGISIDKEIKIIEKELKAFEIIKKGCGYGENQFYTLQEHKLEANYYGQYNDTMELTEEEYKLLKEVLQ